MATETTTMKARMPIPSIVLLRPLLVPSIASDAAAFKPLWLLAGLLLPEVEPDEVLVPAWPLTAACGGGLHSIWTVVVAEELLGSELVPSVVSCPRMLALTFFVLLPHAVELAVNVPFALPLLSVVEHPEAVPVLASWTEKQMFSLARALPSLSWSVKTRVQLPPGATCCGWQCKFAWLCILGYANATTEVPPINPIAATPAKVIFKKRAATVLFPA